MRTESRLLANALLEHHRKLTAEYPPGNAILIRRYLITYHVLCNEAGVQHVTRVVGDFLGEVADWCAQQGYPPLNSLAVSKDTGIPGDGYDKAGGICHIARWPREAETCIRFAAYPEKVA
jgi:hypothetical protein